MTRVAILHAYSADNIGDGFLVEETVALIKEALGEATDITLFAHKPESFPHFAGRIVSTGPSLGFLPGRTALRELRKIRDFDLVVGVGGGYLRMPSPVPAAKCAVVHLPQLFAASRAGEKAVYLAQSIGPLRMGSRPLLRNILGKIKIIAARDDRTVKELGLDNVVRVPDLAVMRGAGHDRKTVDPAGPIVLSVRPLERGVDSRLKELARLLGSFDGFVQSETGKNNDRATMEALNPRRLLSRGEMHGGDGPRRVVIAVRLHAALLALGAGHYVIHLSYERKGFGAFGDLGLSDYVENVFDFDPARVAALAAELQTDMEARRAYDQRVTTARSGLSTERRRVVEDLRSVCGTTSAQADGKIRNSRPSFS